jgi:hypothetical protein
MNIQSRLPIFQTRHLELDEICNAHAYDFLSSPHDGKRHQILHEAEADIIKHALIEILSECR